jgi:hypothetical protein
MERSGVDRSERHGEVKVGWLNRASPRVQKVFEIYHFFGDPS